MIAGITVYIGTNKYIALIKSFITYIDKSFKL